MTDFAAQSEERVNTTTPGDQTAPLVSAWADGSSVVVWNSGTSVYAQRLDASGHPVGTETAIFAGDSQSWSAGGVACLADGSFAVTASTSSYDSGGPHSALYLQRVGASGSPAGAATLVDGSGNYDWSVLGGQVLAQPDGGFEVTALHFYRPTPRTSESAYVQHYDANGSAVGGPVQVSFAAVPEPQSVAVLSNGSTLGAGTDFGAISAAVDWQLVAADGHVVASEHFPFSPNTDTRLGGVTALAGGNALLAWHQQGSGVDEWRAETIDETGHAGAVFTLPFANVQGLRLAATPDGGFMAAWQQNDNQVATFVVGVGYEYSADVSLRAQSFDASGHATSGVVMVDPTRAMTSKDAAPAIPFSLATEADGGFIITTQELCDGADIFAKSYEVAPAPAPGTIPVSTIPDATLDVSGHAGQPVGVPAGNFMIDGGAGLDVLAFASAHTAYSVTASGGVFVLDGPEGHDLLTSVERLQFADHTGIALDVNGNAGMAYRLYQSAFHRAPDLGGLGFQMHELDIGRSFEQVASNFLASPEFQATYGALDDAAFVTQLYANVLHRAPDADGLAYHTSHLAAGEPRSNILIGFSESPENQANVIGSISNGMAYIPV